MAPKQSVSSHRGQGVLPTPVSPAVPIVPDAPTVLATEVFDVVETDNGLANVQAADLVSMTEASQTQQDVNAADPYTADQIPIEASTPSQGPAYLPDLIEAPMSLPTSVGSRGMAPIPGRTQPDEARRH